MSIRIAIDAMGGDYAPKEVVKGAVKVLEENEEIKIIFIGDTEQIKKELDNLGYKKPVEIIHSNQWIKMDESPKTALMNKPDCSICIGTKILNEGQAEVLVSAGNTGATVLAAAKNLSLIEGLERSGLAAIYPTAKYTPESRGFALMMDVGATLNCTPKQLVHFAYMGAYYVSHILEIPEPRVALLNIGEEDNKGGPVLAKTYEYLSQSDDIRFIGNIEGKDIPKGIADVIITDGFIGNVVLKLLEGVGEVVKDTGKYAFKKRLTWKIGLALLASGVKKIKQRTDYSEYGGAPVLGFKKLVIKAHGRSNAKAFANAIKTAYRSAEQDVATHIAESIADFNKKHRLDFIDI